MQPTNPGTTTSESAPPAIPLAVFAVATLAAAEFGFALSVAVHGWQRPPLWPPAGLLVAALLSSDRRRWPLFMLTGIGCTLISRVGLHGQPWLTSLAFSALEAAEASAAAWGLARFARGPLMLDRVGHTLALVAAAAAIPFPTSFVAAALLPPPFGDAWAGWWAGNSLGILLTVPMALGALAVRAAGARPSGLHLLEGFVAFAGVTVMTHGVSGEIFPQAVRAPAYVLPFLLWPAFRFGPGGAATEITLMGSVVFWNAAKGLGPFAMTHDVSLPALILRSQGASWAVGISLLLLASVVAERKRTALERAALVAELRQALADIKTLQGMIPICAWCHKIRDDAGFWQGIDMYLHDHTDVMFSHSICPDCVERVNLGLPSARE